MITQEEKVAFVVSILRELTATIRELGEVPNGHLYAHLMPIMSLEQYNQCIAKLVSLGLISNSNNMLKWKGDQN